MSVHLTSQVYRRQVGNMARTAVMILFADKASDDGSGIWASKQRMADELGASKQTIIATVKSLIADGLVKEVGHRKSPNGYTVEYAINVKALSALPLVKSHAIDQSKNLTGQNPSPVQTSDLTGQAPLPHQSENLTRTTLNRTKPNNRTKQPKGAPQRAIGKPDGVSDQVWHDFVAHRKAKKAPVSETALTGIRREAAKAGWSLEAALAEIVTRGWQGLKADWLASAAPAAQVSGNDFVASVLARHASVPAPSEQLPQEARP